MKEESSTDTLDSSSCSEEGKESHRPDKREMRGPKIRSPPRKRNREATAIGKERMNLFIHESERKGQAQTNMFVHKPTDKKNETRREELTRKEERTNMFAGEQNGNERTKMFVSERRVARTGSPTRIG
jgi:hypothetical protein